MADGEPALVPHGELLRRAWNRRQTMRAAEGQVRRLFAGAYDGLAGLCIDGYAQWATLEISRSELVPHARAWADFLARQGIRGSYLKQRVRGDLRQLPMSELCPSAPLSGQPAPSPLWVREGPLELQVQLGGGLSTGLFLDQRDNRDRLRRAAANQRVLNLFAYTCAFTAAAAAGGAAETVSVDLSKRALARGRENLARNLGAFDPTRHRFVAEDAMAFLPRLQRRGERFGWVVLDPPSFASCGKSVFRVSRDLGVAVSQCLTLLTGGGQLLCATNHGGTSWARLESLIREGAAQAKREIESLARLTPPEDCRHEPADAGTKSVLVQVR